jgi:hypothetical protein
MYTSIQGIFRNGKIELLEQPAYVLEETRVIVTFLHENEVDLKAHGIDQAQAEELRVRLSSFAEDWNAPEMDVYDDYDAAKSIL